MTKLPSGQLTLLVLLVEAYRRTQSEARQPFSAVALTSRDGLVLSHRGLRPNDVEAYPAELQALGKKGLIILQTHTRGAWTFDLTKAGFNAYDRFKQAQSDPFARVEEGMRSYVDRAAFALRHSAACEAWKRAETLLGDGEIAENYTAIGHHCREATQAFATSLLKHFPNPAADPDPAATKSRIAAVLAKHGKMGQRRRVFLQRLDDCWSAVVDLCQRQEHAAAREGDPLTWDDARRVVFMTLVLMTEIDSALSCVQPLPNGQ